jgi:uncharacterized Zn finger protein
MFADAQPGGSGNMQILTACPLCQANYNPLKTQIMAEREDAHLLYLECRQCGSSVVAVVTTGQSGLTSVGAVTDLTSQEIVAFQDKDEVTSDDVLELYDWLEKSDRRLTAL